MEGLLVLCLMGLSLHAAGEFVWAMIPGRAAQVLSFTGCSLWLGSMLVAVL